MVVLNNGIFDITVNEKTGAISSIVNPRDEYKMNFCAKESEWGIINCVNTDSLQKPELISRKEMKLDSFSFENGETVSIYSNQMLRVTVSRFFAENGNFKERYTVENLRDCDVFTRQDNFGITVPFNDRYPSAEECMHGHCHAHIWCGKNTTYVNALRMGVSDINLGLVLTRGSIESYSQSGVGFSNRGVFQLNSSFFAIAPSESHTIEWELFWHKGNSDFEEKIKSYPQVISVESENYTVFSGEEIVFSFKLPRGAENVSVKIGDNEIPYTIKENTVTVKYLPDSLGEHRFDIKAGDVITYTEFFVAEEINALIKKRLDFIADKQQYRNKSSDLYGAYLIYDTKEKYHVFDSFANNHNACRERVGMALAMVKYLQKHEDEKLLSSLNLFIEFLKREFYDEQTGAVYGNIHKDEKFLRLYNAPWIVRFFSEMYFLTRDAYYTDNIVKIVRRYYEQGGADFYPNGISYIKAISALKDAENPDTDEIFALFKAHADNIVKKGIYYPAHEVNYEQTIVTPAVSLISEMGMLTGEKKYTEEARAHVEILERFSGHQPSFHLNETPIRFWDDYWFGKGLVFADNFPHYWSCLTARAFKEFYKLSGEEKYLVSAGKGMRNCLCLFNDKGEGACAYVYPYMSNGKHGAFYDEWANDQDYALYFYLDMM